MNEHGEVTLETDHLEEVIDTPSPGQPVVVIQYRTRGLPWYVILPAFAIVAFVAAAASYSFVTSRAQPISLFWPSGRSRGSVAIIRHCRPVRSARLDNLTLAGRAGGRSVYWTAFTQYAAGRAQPNAPHESHAADRENRGAGACSHQSSNAFARLEHGHSRCTDEDRRAAGRRPLPAATPLKLPWPQHPTRPQDLPSGARSLSASPSRPTARALLTPCRFLPSHRVYRSPTNGRISLPNGRSPTRSSPTRNRRHP